MRFERETCAAADVPAQQILVTGATGFLGGEVATRLLSQQPQHTLFFLVRAEDTAQGLSRLIENLTSHGAEPATLARLQPDHIVLGDLGDPSWIEPAKPQLMQMDRVINCAAVASFSKNPRIWPVNVEGTFAFAKVMSESPRLQRFLHVGTAMCCGPSKDSLLVSESWQFPESDEQLVDYTASKAEIERRMRSELPTLPLVVARPSIVVGHTRTGCQASGSIYWVFRMGFALSAFTCDLQDRIDVIPADFCADTLIRLAMKPKLKYDLYHVSAGEDKSCSFEQIDAAYAQASGTSPVRDHYRRVTHEQLPTLAQEFQVKIGKTNPRLVMRAMRLYSNFADLSYVFKNERLTEEGIALPPAFTDYIQVCVDSSKDVTIPEQMTYDFK